MTRKEIEAVGFLREQGLSATKIAEKTGLSVNTVKSYLRRHPVDEGKPRCLTCGAPLIQVPGKKEKKFCSDLCRSRWWNRHADLRQRTGARQFTCAHCGKVFFAYKDRKYCSHACYVEERFRGGES